MALIKDNLIVDGTIARVGGLTTQFLKANGDVDSRTFLDAATVTKADVGLANVDNTSDLDKLVSTATQTALDLKADKATTYTKTEVNASLANKVSLSNIGLSEKWGDVKFTGQTGLNSYLNWYKGAGAEERLLDVYITNSSNVSIKAGGFTNLGIHELGVQLSAKYALIAHSHVISDVTGLQAALDAKATTASLAAYSTTVQANALYASLTGYNKANWDSAYGWGNHATYGYITNAALTPYRTAAAQDTLMAGYQLLTGRNAVNGYAGLDGNGKLDPNQLPVLAITNTFVVATEAAMLLLVAEVGDIAIRTDVSKSFILKTTDATVLANWEELRTPTDALTTVFGRAGVITAQVGDYAAFYQPLDSDLTAIAGLSGTSGFLKTNGSGTWSVDTISYATTTALGSYLPLAGGTMNVGSKLKVANSATGGAGFNIGASTGVVPSSPEDGDLYHVGADALIFTTTSVSRYVVLSTTGGLTPTFTSVSISGGTAAGFLKANGTVDTTAYAASSALGSYVPLAGGTMNASSKLTFATAVLASAGINIGLSTGVIPTTPVDGDLMHVGADALLFKTSTNARYIPMSTTAGLNPTFTNVTATAFKTVGAVTNTQFVKGDGSLDASVYLTSATVTKAMIGLGNVDNTSDANKPLSTAATTALAGKENTIAPGTVAQYWRGDKTWQTLVTTSQQSAVLDDTTVFIKRQIVVRLCYVATSATYSGLASIDGITPIAGDLILVTHPTTHTKQGVWVASATTWTRATEMDTAIEMSDRIVKVTSGTLYTNTFWSMVSKGVAITPDTTPLKFGQVYNDFSSEFAISTSGVVSLATIGVTAGTYKSVTVNNKGVVTAGTNPTTVDGFGITDAYTKTEIDASYCKAKKFVIGDNSATSFLLTHNFNNLYCSVFCIESATGVIVIPKKFSWTSTSTCTLELGGAAIATGAITVIVHDAK